MLALAWRPLPLLEIRLAPASFLVKVPLVRLGTALVVASHLAEVQQVPLDNIPVV